MAKKYGLSFSWKRALGISGYKNKISRQIGIPLTRNGRRMKYGKMMGCSLYLIFLVLLIFSVILIISVI